MMLNADSLSKSCKTHKCEFGVDHATCCKPEQPTNVAPFTKGTVAFPNDSPAEGPELGSKKQYPSAVHGIVTQITA